MYCQRILGICERWPSGLERVQGLALGNEQGVALHQDLRRNRLRIEHFRQRFGNRGNAGGGLDVWPRDLSVATANRHRRPERVAQALLLRSSAQ